MKTNKKLFAIFAVSAMLAVCCTSLAVTDESDAATGSFEALYPGSWTWNTTTGIGPFNSFYAAFDAADGNKLVAILDPYDLTKKIDGTNLGDGQYNIMWIVPTIYWSTDDNGNIELTNDSTSGGVAYAHTIDGHVYSYLAIGVYHGSKQTINSVDYLMSKTGVAPTASQTRAVFRDQANNYIMDPSLGSDAHSMLWNFYQWELYKLCAYTVMEGFNSQAIVGNGNVNGGNYTKPTGGCNQLGPYAGNNGDLNSSASTYGRDYAKLFIEEPWGTVLDFVDGVTISGTKSYYLDSSSVPTDSTTAGGNVVLKTIDITGTSGNFPTSISTDPTTWGYGVNGNGTYQTGLTDKLWFGTNGPYLLCVGGYSDTSGSYAPSYGLSYADASNILSTSYVDFGSRLAFVFDDAGSAATTPANFTYKLEYDASTMGQTAAQSLQLVVQGMNPITHDAPQTYTVTVQPDPSTSGSVSPTEVSDLEGATITVNGTSLTIGSTTVVAVPNASTDQYDFEFDGWYYSDNTAVTNTTLTQDLSIYAKFTNNVRSYFVVIEAGQGGSVDPSSISNVPYGSAIFTNGNTLAIGTNTVTATVGDPTAQYTYNFGSWTYGDGSMIPAGAIITGDTTLKANFTAMINTYTVTFQSSDPAKGTVEPVTISNVPYGTFYNIQGNIITLNGTQVTATASDGYELRSWNVDSSTMVVGNQTVTANFDEPYNTNNNLLDMIPLMVIITIMMFAASAAINLYRDGDVMLLVKMSIGLTVCIVVFTAILIPALSG